MDTDDAFVYPTDQVVGVLPDAARLDDTLDELRRAGVGDDRIDVVRGGRDSEDLAPDPSEGGVVETVVRTVQHVFGDEAERLKVLDEALEAGHHVIAIHLAAEDDDERDAEKATLGAILRQNGAQDVAFYGRYQIQQLDAGAT